MAFAHDLQLQNELSPPFSLCALFFCNWGDAIKELKTTFRSEKCETQRCKQKWRKQNER